MTAGISFFGALPGRLTSVGYQTVVGKITGGFSEGKPDMKEAAVAVKSLFPFIVIIQGAGEVFFRHQGQFGPQIPAGLRRIEALGGEGGAAAGTQ